MSSLSKSTLQQVTDSRSFPDGDHGKSLNEVPHETPHEDSVLLNAIDDFQQARTKTMQDLVLNITRLAWQECSGFSSSESHASLLGALDDLRLAVESTTDTVLRLIYQVCPFFVSLNGMLIVHPKPPQNAALRTVVEMGLFRVLLEAQQDPTRSSEVTADQLAVVAGSEKVLVCEFLCPSIKFYCILIQDGSTAHALNDVLGTVQNHNPGDLHGKFRNHCIWFADWERWRSLHVSILYLYPCVWCINIADTT